MEEKKTTNTWLASSRYKKKKEHVAHSDIGALSYLRFSLFFKSHIFDPFMLFTWMCPAVINTDAVWNPIKMKLNPLSPRSLAELEAFAILFTFLVQTI